MCIYLVWCVSRAVSTVSHWYTSHATLSTPEPVDRDDERQCVIAAVLTLEQCLRRSLAGTSLSMWRARASGRQDTGSLNNLD